MPTDGKIYSWDEATTSWVEVVVPEVMEETVITAPAEVVVAPVEESIVEVPVAEVTIDAGTATPTILEAWELDGCFLSQVDWGDMAYNSNDPVQIALTIKFDNAIQTVGGGVGTTVVTQTPGTSIN